MFVLGVFLRVDLGVFCILTDGYSGCKKKGSPPKIPELSKNPSYEPEVILDIALRASPVARNPASPILNLPGSFNMPFHYPLPN